jgi:hypothetical protein
MWCSAYEPTRIEGVPGGIADRKHSKPANKNLKKQNIDFVA